MDWLIDPLVLSNGAISLKEKEQMILRDKRKETW